MNNIQQEGVLTAPINRVFKIAYFRRTGIFLINVLILWFWLSQIGIPKDYFRIFIALLLFFNSLRVLISLIYNYDLKVHVTNTEIAITEAGSTSVIPWNDIEILWKKQYKYTANLIPIINIRNLNIEDASGKIYKLSGLLGKYNDLQEIIISEFVNQKFS